ncbi:MAG: hypothetical protein V9G12_18645 [Microthrixaceae bacterium]
METGLAVGVGELPALVQPGRARVADLGDGPEQAVLGFDALPGGARVVGGATRGRPAELVEDLVGVLVLEVLALAEPLGDLQQDLPVQAGLARVG